eukprot:scaffold3782_cov170-Amphora_coffeaeformis.AAC.2
MLRIFASLFTLLASSPTSLRIIQINDVYELTAFPHLKTLIREKSTTQQSSSDHDETTTKTLVVCAGDFLSPSLLSSLDKGASMVDALNCVGVTHVCLGNHEFDVGMEALAERLQQSQFTWINSNMQTLNDTLPIVTDATGSRITTPRYVTVNVGKRKVALLGLLTDDSSLYRPGMFGVAKIEPVAQATASILREFSSMKEDVDLVIPLTHQSIAADREFCLQFTGKFPLVCGGHDHEVYDETVEGARIIKAGMDAIHAAVIDIQWNDNDDETGNHDPVIRIELIPTADYAPDPELVQRIRGHRKILENLQRARLFRISDWLDNYSHNIFSTRNNRLGPSTGTSAIATMLRMGMRVTCAILNAGSVRGNKVYSEDQEFFTWSDLKGEMPFSSQMTALDIPGRVLEATIAGSRSRLQETSEASGAYIHCCSNIQFNDETMRIERIRGAPFNPDKLYLTTLPALLLSGLDNHKPLLEWVETSQIQPESFIEMAIPAKMLIVEVFASLLWLQLGSFDDVDRNRDGVICRDDVKARVVEVYGEGVADLVVNSIFSVADMNNDGTITPLEMAIIGFGATDLIDHVCSAKELAAMKRVASQVLEKDPSHEDVKQMVTLLRDTVDSLDDDIDGFINRNELVKAKGGFGEDEVDLLK